MADVIEEKVDSTTATPNYDINYNDSRFTQVETQKSDALNELEKTYSGMIGESDKYYQAQIDASKEWADKQSQLQQEQTDFAIEQVEQQKQQAHSDYLKEQSGAYVDYKKQSDQYGINAEQRASAGLNGTGYSESSMVSMYTTYQNRVAAARESYTRAVLNYDNAIKEARLQNNAALAEIAFQTLQQQLELSLQGFQYKNTLVLEQANKKLELENNYYNRYMDVLNQINQENALAETIRQFNEEQALKQAQLDEEKRQFDFVNKLGEFANSGGGGYDGGSGGGGGDNSVYIPKTTKTNNDDDDGSSGGKVILTDDIPKVYSAQTINNKVASGEYKEVTLSNGDTIISTNNRFNTNSAATSNPGLVTQIYTPSTTNKSNTSALSKVMNVINNAVNIGKKYS